jgi:RNA polymerase sigma factor (sigma-70 family)
MRKYNIQNYIRYKEDLKETLRLLPDYGNDYEKYTRKQLTTKFLPLVETMARKFSTSDQASGVLSIMDLIQEGSAGLTKAVDRLDHKTLKESEDKEKTLKSFFSKRIKGAIRRRIDMLRGNIRIPEHQLNKIRKDNGKDQKMVAMFFNSIFLSIDAQPIDDENLAYQIPDKSEPYNIHLMNAYLKSLMQKHLDFAEYEVLRLSYGLDCDKHSAKEIAAKLGIEGVSNYVRISELKKQAVQRLIDNVDHSQVLDYL